ncbi:MAG TPA: signal peptidase II [bacterium]|nr:signal peptidase II [bacterium]
MSGADPEVPLPPADTEPDEGPSPVAGPSPALIAARYRMLAIVSFLVVVTDQIVKRWVVGFFGNVEGRTRTIVPGFFDLILTRNPGAAWGMLGTLKPDALRIAVFVLISLAAIAMVIWLARKARVEQRLLVSALALVLGGALGNLVDRIVAGRVVDFLDFYTHAEWFMGLAAKVHYACDAGLGCHWPAFNVADICISVGVALLVLESFLSPPRKT